MISYCIAVYRPTYARLLLADLVKKTSVPFEILVWLNVADPALDAEIAAAIGSGVPAASSRGPCRRRTPRSCDQSPPCGSIPPARRWLTNLPPAAPTLLVVDL